MQSRLRRLSWILEEAFRQWNGSEICACPNFAIIISTGCIENEQVESIPIKVRHHAVLEADRGEAYTRKVVEQVDRIGVAVLDIKHTDLIRLQ